MKKCQFCAEEIQDAAIKCRYCGSDVTVAPSPPSNVAVASPPSSNKSFLNQPVGGVRGLGFLAVGIGFVLTVASSTLAGFGILLLWVGFSLVMSGGLIMRLGGAFIAALIFGSVGLGLGRSTSPSATTTTSNSFAGAAGGTSARPPTPAEPQLALISSRGYESEYGGYHYVEGQVKNISDQSLKNVTAVATWFDKNDQFIKTAEAIIEYNPILPGQTSPFKTITSGNPAMSRFRVEFKTLMGGKLRVEDQTK